MFESLPLPILLLNLNGKIMLFESFLCAVGLAGVHVFAGYIRFLNRTPRSYWLSLASGVAIAFVFVHIFPSLGAWQAAIESSGGTAIGFVQYHAYLVALVGMLFVHGVQSFAAASQKSGETAQISNSDTTAVFWLHVLTFALFNVLISYLLVHRSQPGRRGLLLYFVAMAVYLLVFDYNLRKTYGQAYERVGRWVLAAAVIDGWLVGITTEIGQGTLAILFAFLAGGTIVSVIKEELAIERAGSFWAFLIGAVFYVLLLLAQ